MRIKYNAPTVLSFTLLCAIILLLDRTVFPHMIDNVFTVPGRGFFQAGNLFHWISIVTHAAGHADWAHLIYNFTLILIIGPMLEENYGSIELLEMILITAAVTGILNVLFFRSYLLGASGILFMMILLSSFTNFSKGEIPLTFILVMILYIGVEIFNMFRDDNISQFAHIIGGLCGSFFGFLLPNDKKRTSVSAAQRR